MRITDQRYLPGDNRYTTQPCLLSILELDASAPTTPGALASFQQRLQALLPGVHRLRNLVGKRTGAGCEVPYLVQAVQQVAIELRRLVSNEVTVAFVGVVPRMHGRYRLVLPYTMQHTVEPALEMATQLVDALLAGRACNLGMVLARLRALAERRHPTRAA
ncbi:MULTISPECIES: hypothetical protein [unclassified Duganella]|uniref:cyanophycin synthetase family protein n=1 Tax=unclassified Duganella TaxID=2636909 RepID=UPI000E3548FD|nr:MULTISPECIES: hypothetical protein [unclassified Duganella]RFP15091.1 hypothetical protein D0T23_11385 [Duganella sp. BJB475]RFP31475.1 hypothetical protein D0T21_13765 [Duganella sp. BJB476]